LQTLCVSGEKEKESFSGRKQKYSTVIFNNRKGKLISRCYIDGMFEGCLL